MYLIGSIGFSLQSAVTLYIYRVGKTYPARNPVYRSKSINNSNCTRTPPRPVRPVGPTGQTRWSCQTIYRCLDRSDRLDTLVRPVCSGYCQFWSSTLCMIPGIYICAIHVSNKEKFPFSPLNFAQNPFFPLDCETVRSGSLDS